MNRPMKEPRQQTSYTPIEVDRKNIYSAPNLTPSYSSSTTNSYFTPLEM